MQRVRVLQIAKHFYPDPGGIETVTQAISDMLPGHGIQADVLCTATKRDYPSLDRRYRVIRCAPGFQFGRNKNISIDYMRAVGRLSDDYDAAILHLPNPVGAIAALAGWRKPLILLWHADIPQRWIRAAATLLDRAIVARADRVIGPTSAHLQESHRAASFGDKGAVIALPFESSRMATPDRTSQVLARVDAFSRGRPVVLSVGRLVAYKGFDVLIEAAKSFGNELASVIVGSGPLHRELEELIVRSGVQDRVMLAGPVDDQGLADLFDRAQMVCMPSVTAAEMYGMVQVEAFAFGKPVVSTRISRSGVASVNRDGETGFVVAPGDPQALVEALLRLARDEELLARLSAGAVKSFREDHALDAVAARYASLIREVVAESPYAVKG